MFEFLNIILIILQFFVEIIKIMFFTSPIITILSIIGLLNISLGNGRSYKRY